MIKTARKVSVKDLIVEAKKLFTPLRAEHSQYFFKTGPGQYGAGDIFWGLSVPESRLLAKRYQSLSLDDLKLLLRQEVHELRLIALLILLIKYQATNLRKDRKNIIDFYLSQTGRINNWDLVDLTAYKLLGAYLVEYRLGPGRLYKLASSKNMWERRLAIVATVAFIKAGDFEPTQRLSRAYLKESVDLMHKASGWMLREVGKRNEAVLTAFLDNTAAYMPRTMLRYAIERFPEKKRQKYLKIKTLLK
jgi:3-methyladenine DNA glycosylase AlkD